MVFIDADKENYIRYWDLCLPKLKRGGLIVADNVLSRDSRVETVMLTVRDGITLAWKK